MACQPAFVLSPSTIQNGAFGSCTTTWADVVEEWTTVKAGAGPELVAWTRPEGVGGRAAPPGAESRTRLSMSKSTPGETPGWVWISWLPAARVIPWAELPHPLTSSAPSDAAVAVVPVTLTGTGTPSTASRLLRHVPGSVAGASRESATPGIDIWAMPMGRPICLLEYWSRSVTVRTVSNVIRSREPVRAGNCSDTVWIAHGLALSAKAGSATLRLCPPALTVTVVGTECRPSVTMVIPRWSKVMGLARLYSSQLPAWGPRPGLHTVVGFPSSVEEARSWMSPGSRPDE